MRTRLFSAFAAILCHAAVVAAFSLPADKKVVTDRITSLMIECEFERSLALCDSLFAADTTDPLALILKLSAIGLKDMDLDQNLSPQLFERWYQEARACIDALADDTARASYGLLLKGFAQASYASYCLRAGRYFSAVQIGLAAIGNLQTAQNLDSSNTDVDFFLGLYECARADLRKRLRWALFWYPGNRQHGIRRLETCARTGQVSATASRLSLADLYTQDGLFDKAQAMLTSLDREFPSSRFVLWAWGRFHEARRQPLAAAAGYGRLSESYANVEHGGYNSLVTGRKQAELLLAGADTAACAQACSSLLKRCGATSDARARAVCKDMKKLAQKAGRRG